MKSKFNAIVPPPYIIENTQTGEKESVGQMGKLEKALAFFSLAIAAFLIGVCAISVMSLLTGCESAGYSVAPADIDTAPDASCDPAPSDPGCDQALTECLNDITTPPPPHTVAVESTSEVTNGYAVTDWETKSKTCESELAQSRANEAECENKSDTTYQRQVDLRNALRYFDLTEICANGDAKPWICEADRTGNL